MRIALVIERMDVARGGRETSTAQIASGLARRGHKVTVLCQAAAWRADGIDVRALGGRGLGRTNRLRNFLADVGRAIGPAEFDVVHAMLPLPGADVYQPRGGTVPGQAAAAFRRRSPAGKLAAAAIGPLNRRRRLLGEAERAVVADPRVLCLPVSHMVAEEFLQFYDRTENVRVIYNGVDVPDGDGAQRADWRQKRRFQMEIGQEDVVFLTVATNFELKGVAEAIAAFARWHNSRGRRIKARLVVVGRDFVEGYQRHAGLRDVGGQVVFVPRTDEVFQWYAAADACILLSWYDPCSRVVLEAARWGIPSITTIYNGAAEVLAEGAGVVVGSPRDARAVAAAMDELADPKRRAARAEACLRIADRLSMDRHVAELLDAYAAVTKR